MKNQQKPNSNLSSAFFFTLCFTLFIQLIIQKDLNEIEKHKEKQHPTDTITIAKKQLIEKILKENK